MTVQNGPLELTDLGLSKVNIEVRFAGESESESTYRPAFVRLGPEGMFLHWPDPPSDLQKLQIEWSDCPFTAQPFRCECTVLESSGEGLQVKLDGPTPATMKEWFERISTLAKQREPDSALKTSRLYTGATVVSAGGLFCGALAILLPILSSGQWWIDAISKVLLLVMVASIAGFAWIRFLAGRAEVRAIRQSPG